VIILCPQCQGIGYIEERGVWYGEDGRYAKDEAPRCPICACSHVGDPDGCLVLPLNPDVADAIYSDGNAAACALVYDAYLDDPSHLILHGPDRIACGVALDGGSAATVDAERVTCPACFVAVKGNRAA
jgi:hypothetical protein